MRRRLVLVVLVVVMAITAVIVAQDPQPPIILPEPPPRTISGNWEAPIRLEVEPVDPLELLLNPEAINAPQAAGDECEAATVLSIEDGAGDSTVVSNLTEAATDPTLSCMWPGAGSDQGYRTGWYKFTPTRNGRVTVSTLRSSYDTVVAVYTGTCDNLPDSLSQLACNDDHQLFTSRVSFNVQKGKTYYIEVADWHSAAPGQLNLAVVLEPLESEWRVVTLLEDEPRSRHVAIPVGTDLYVIGGQSEVEGTPTFLRRVDRYDTITGDWQQRAGMPGSAGYANTTAALLDGRIYFPSGDTGGNSFAGEHLAYHIAADSWTLPGDLPNVPWTTYSGGNPVAWAAAVTSQGVVEGYYLIGGTSDTDLTNSHDSMFLFDRNAGQWRPRSPMNTSRYGHTAAWVNNRVCVAGGIHVNDSDQLVLENSAECYNPTNGVWTGIDNLNVARYGAESAVGPNGKWYVFAGATVDANNKFVAASETEVYDPQTGQWTVLDATFDLGGAPTWPARFWPRGGFIGNHLWAVGGNTIEGTGQQSALPMVERLYLPPHALYNPIVLKSGAPPNDDNFDTARRLVTNQPVEANFDTQLDFYDVYYFNLAQQQSIRLTLTQIPDDHDLDLAVYNSSKLLLAEGTNLPGQNEDVTVNGLPAGRYYVVVERVFPTGEPNPGVFYRLELK